MQKQTGFFSPRHTFSCGQCFRWTEQEDGSYLGVAYGTAARVWAERGQLRVTGGPEEYQRVWLPYFDLERDYAAVAASLPDDPFLRQAIAHGQGLRILAQEPWEALCSFLISQCNHIPRIRAIVEALCRQLGRPILFEGKTLYAFPTPQALSGLTVEELAPLRAGYRAKYLLSAAQALSSGRLDLDGLRALSTEEAREKLMELPGVGRKVADCVLLFGLGKLDAFPVDTWMKKAGLTHPDAISACAQGPWAGIAQQYIFYYARSIQLAPSTNLSKKTQKKVDE